MLSSGFLFGLEAVRDVVHEVAESFYLVHGDDAVGLDHDARSARWLVG